MRFLAHLRVTGLTALLSAIGCASAGAAIQWLPSSLKKVYHSTGDFYCYAPAVIRDDGGAHYWFCRNAAAGVIRDHIYYLKQTPAGFDPLQLAFGPSSGHTWDSFHVCDPSIVGGNFGLGGRSFKYALVYLGNNVDASVNNQVGIAFSNDAAGGWVRRPEPLVSYPPQGHWGVGQPSAINLDGKGRIAVFYTKADPRAAGYFREVNLGGEGTTTAGQEIKLPSAGLLRTDGRPDYLNDFDVAYDSMRERYIVVREVHPYPSTDPDFISTTLEISSISAEEIRNPDGRWTREGIIGPGLTGHARNHNAGIEKTWSGALPDPHMIRVVFTVSCAGPECAGRKPLWTYGLWQICGRITR